MATKKAAADAVQKLAADFHAEDTAAGDFDGTRQEYLKSERLRERLRARNEPEQAE